ncbi:MAG: 4Fe-4S binding protein [Candidatus Verstraetearchaeota archaeon]|nr:4Fe-4S binding protein [Candidatus Verstraetearchaeota archaeon]
MKCFTPQLKGWREIPEGGTITEPGSSVNFDVTAWRTSTPVIDQKKCTKCGMCFLFCPDSAIELDVYGNYGVNLSYCKGCGICAKGCAVKAITMVKEAN